MSWTPERVERLRILWADGHSCSIIASMLGGITRNAVIGKVSRLGLPRRKTMARINGTRHRGKHQPHPWHKPKPQPTAKPFVFGKGPASPTVQLPTLPLPMPTADDKARVSFADLEHTHCRWPVGETLNALPTTPVFCGLDRMPGSSYCMGHHARAFVPLSPRLRLPAESNVVPMPKRETVAA
jgi:GcrA cell cycle regulator